MNTDKIEQLNQLLAGVSHAIGLAGAKLEVWHDGTDWRATLTGHDPARGSTMAHALANVVLPDYLHTTREDEQGPDVLQQMLGDEQEPQA